MKTRIALNGNDGTWRIGIGETARWEASAPFDWQEMDEFLAKYRGSYVFTTLSYELRKLIAENVFPTEQAFPLALFWVPENVYIVQDGFIDCVFGKPSSGNELLAMECLSSGNKPINHVDWKAGQTKEDYLTQLKQLQSHIQQGDCYEVNYCQEFYAHLDEIPDPLSLYHGLNKSTGAPFSLFLENDDWIIASASPERFIRKDSNRLISQPIKGTAPRGKDEQEDRELKASLAQNLKDRTENVMIVDLVRNDLSRVAAKGSVKVDELFGVYTFPTVHQLISTISCELREGTRFSDILKATFPMGSMTGAPKVAAMELAEKTERFTRGIYSGAIGYFAPSGNFDLNVMIRSLVLNKQEKYLSCGVGGAITALSDPEQEYEECRTKVGRILEIFGTCQW